MSVLANARMRLVQVFGGRQIELSRTVVAPMGNSHGVLVLQVIKCGPKERFLSHESTRGFKITYSTFIADHDKPKNDGSCVVNSRRKCRNRHFPPVIKHTKVLLLEISDGQPVIGILADDIN